MDMNFLDFGLDSESEGEDSKMDCMDSDEEDEIEAATLLKMMTSKIPMPHSKTKKEQDLENFQAEMEMELNRRAQAVESEGGVEHQKSLSRSSSTSSLNTTPSAVASTSSTFGDNVAAATKAMSRKSSMKKKSAKNETETQESTTKQRSVRFTEDPAAATSEKVVRDKAKEMYDEIYFDSDEDQEEDSESKEKRKSGRKFLTNDELFYDPAADDKDQDWVDNQRTSYFSPPQSQPKAAAGKSKSPKPEIKPLPNSDAVLNCAACFTVLCLDCQKHEFYEGQYRAMFVRNCVTNKTENRYVPSKSERFKNRKRKVNGELPAGSVSMSEPEPADIFNPVNCKVCNTEVAVIDRDEVYHFFNVLSSHS